MSYDLTYSILVGIGILIGLPLLLTFYSEEKFNVSTVLIYMCIINAFLVSTGLFPMWTQIMFLIIVAALGIIELKSNKNNGVM